MVVVVVALARFVRGPVGLSCRRREHAVEERFQRHDGGADDGCVDLQKGPVDSVHSRVAVIDTTVGGGQQDESYYGDDADAENGGQF